MMKKKKTKKNTRELEKKHLAYLFSLADVLCYSSLHLKEKTMKNSIKLIQIYIQLKQIVVIIKDWSGMNLKRVLTTKVTPPPPNICFSLPGPVSSHLDHSEPRLAAFQ